MRDAFVKVMHDLAASDPRVMLVTGDLGFGVLDAYAEDYPAQYLNVGVAEQNMSGIAAGLAMAGRKVFTYSIANFPTLRCLEQIRNDICYHDLDVTVVAIGGGLSYGALGFSHQATEDLAIMRSLPNMMVVAPGDDEDAAEATRVLAEVGGPAYLRLDRSAPPLSQVTRSSFRLGQLSEVSSTGTDVLLVSTGSLLATTHEVALRLAERGFAVTHVSAPSIKPFDSAGLEATLGRGFRLVVTVEEHSIIGGLGGVVAETVTEPGRANPPVPVLRCGLPDVLPSIVGSQEYLRAQFGLSAEAIERQVVECLDRLVLTQ